MIRAPIVRVGTKCHRCHMSRVEARLGHESEKSISSPIRSVAQERCLWHVVFGEEVIQRFGQQVVDLFAVVARVGLQLCQRAPHGAWEVRADQHGFFDFDRSTLPRLDRLFALPARSGQLAELGRAFLEGVRHVLYSYYNLVTY